MKTKFKVGDRVKVRVGDGEFFSAGDTGNIIRDPYKVNDFLLVEFDLSPTVFVDEHGRHAWYVKECFLRKVHTGADWSNERGKERLLTKMERIMSNNDRFVVDGKWEVSFLYNKPITACIIRNLNTLGRAGGVAVCNPKDVWDPAIGRHKAMLDAFKTVSGFARQKYSGDALKVIAGIEDRIKKAYWEHYKHLEK